MVDGRIPTGHGLGGRGQRDLDRVMGVIAKGSFFGKRALQLSSKLLLALEFPQIRANRPEGG